MYKLMKFPTPVLFQLFLFVVIPPWFHRNSLSYAAAGRWDLLLSNIGVSAMHMQLLHTDRVVIYDRTDFGPSNITLPGGKCLKHSSGTASWLDCTAHSVEYDVATNSIRSLTVLTDVWCSSGAVMADGTLVQTGGFRYGNHVVRIYRPCGDQYSCDWDEISEGLAQKRWYATNQILPDGRVIIIGGRTQFNYEFYPKKPSEKSFFLPFLVQTNDPKIENNLYPFVFLNIDGNLFIFANNRAILFDYVKGLVVRSYPTIPGGDPRNYPSTGSAALLPLTNNVAANVLVCGGAPKGAYINAKKGTFTGALNTCGRIQINDPNPIWVMETMPMGRVMGDMVLLPNGNVLIINGAASGTAGWELGRDPVLNPVIYRPDNQVGSRFEVQNPSTIPRMYHSSALLLRDGRVLVGGNNPHKHNKFRNILYPTDLSLEAFSPSYLDSNSANLRPKIISPGSHSEIGYVQLLDIQFSIPGGIVNGSRILATMVAPSFATHSFSMSQRLLVLRGKVVTIVGNSTFRIRVATPVSGHLAPTGYYFLFVVHGDIPSEGVWIHIK